MCIDHARFYEQFRSKTRNAATYARDARLSWRESGPRRAGIVRFVQSVRDDAHACPDSCPRRRFAGLGCTIAEGEESWHNSKPKAWKQEVKRFHAALARLDRCLAKAGELSASCERIFQGPIADALTHVGQIAMLRRLAGEPIKGENYSRAEIVAGQVESRQPKPRREFD